MHVEKEDRSVTDGIVDGTLADESISVDQSYSESRTLLVELCLQLPPTISEKALELLDVIDLAPQDIKSIYLGIHRELVEYVVELTQNAELFRTLMEGEVQLNGKMGEAIEKLREQLRESIQTGESKGLSIKRAIEGNQSKN